MTEERKKWLREIAFVRGAVDFASLVAGRPIYVLDGERMSKAEYEAHQNRIGRFLVPMDCAL